jgi:hypothetical protein
MPSLTVGLLTKLTLANTRESMVINDRPGNGAGLIGYADFRDVVIEK